MTILVADDEESMRTLVNRVLMDGGYDVCLARDGVAALELYEEVRPDLVILDVMMPKKNGFEVCAALRGRGETVPIIILTAKGDIVDKSVGFTAGADDYLVKPFLPKELLLRVEALLRRRGYEATQQAHMMPTIVEYPGLTIDVQSRQVIVRGKPVNLTPKEFHVLHMLALHPGKVFTKDKIIEDVWGPEYVGGSSSITVLIRRIRTKIEEDPSDPQYLQTVWHVGYCFKGE